MASTRMPSKGCLHFSFFSFSCQKRWNKKAPLDTVDHYSVLKKNEILILATTWLNLEDFILNEISQPQKNKNGTIPLTEGTQNNQIHNDGTWKSGSQGSGKEEGGQ